MEKMRRIIIVTLLLLLCALPVAAQDAWVRIVVPGAQWSPYQDAWVLPAGPLRFELQASMGGWDRMLVSARRLPVADWALKGGALLIRPYHMRLEPGAGRFLVLPLTEVCPGGLYEVKAMIYRGERRLSWDVKYISVTMLTAGRGYDVFPLKGLCPHPLMTLGPAYVWFPWANWSLRGGQKCQQ